MLVLTHKRRGPFNTVPEIELSGPHTFSAHPATLDVKLSFSDASHPNGNHALEIYMTPQEAVHLMQALYAEIEHGAYIRNNTELLDALHMLSTRLA